jgi:hypothetical protein
MSDRIAAVVSVVLASFLAGVALTTVSGSAARGGDDCVAEPGDQPPRGDRSHHHGAPVHCGDAAATGSVLERAAGRGRRPGDHDPSVGSSSAGSSSAGSSSVSSSSAGSSSVSSSSAGSSSAGSSSTGSSSTGSSSAGSSSAGSSATLNDGSAAAAGGPAQFPTILNVYGGTNARNKDLIAGKQYQPPWNVAGVDYAVGPKQGTVFKDGTNASLVAAIPAGSGSVSLSAGQVHIDVGSAGNVITIDSFDFTGLANIMDASGGNSMFLISGGGGGAVVIQNCKMRMSGNAAGPRSTFIKLDASLVGTVTFQYCDMDLNGEAIGSNAANNFGSGPNPWSSFIVESASAATAQNYLYNYIHNGVYGGLAPNASPSSDATQPVTIKYNVFAYNNYQWTPAGAPQSHFDPIIWYGGLDAGTALTIQFNTFYQPEVDQNGKQIGFINGMVRIGDTSTQGFAGSADLGWNTFVAPGGGYGVMGTNGGGTGSLLSIFQITGSGGGPIQNVTVHDNFCDFSFIFNQWVYQITSGMNDITYANNIILNTGGQTPAFSGSGPGTFTPAGNGGGGVWLGQGQGGTGQRGADQFGFPPFVAPTANP